MMRKKVALLLWLSFIDDNESCEDFDFWSAMDLVFSFQVRKKDQINIESKLKTVRFIGETNLCSVCVAVDLSICC